MLSVCAIQGKWCEENTTNMWEVSGIVAQRTKVPRAQMKPIVLNDGPAGVEWGNGNLKGNLEDGWLVWRNRRGEATYCWKKLEEGLKVASTEPMMTAAKAKQHTSPAQVPTKTDLQLKVENHSPRSTNSGTSNETAEMMPGMASLMMNASDPVERVDDVSVAEVKMLLEMASNRLLAGDVYMSMRYITLA